jgi:predicted nucleic acid-binding protein
VIPLVFADANVFFAGSASRRGASHAVLVLAEIGLIQLMASRQVLEEVERNLRRKFPEGLPVLTEWLTLLNLEVLPDPTLEEFVRWIPLIEEKDAPILEAAVQAEVDYLVTLNTKDFTSEVAAATGLTLLTPGAFIQNVRKVLMQNL